VLARRHVQQKELPNDLETVRLGPRRSAWARSEAASHTRTRHTATEKQHGTRRRLALDAAPKQLAPGRLGPGPPLPADRSPPLGQRGGGGPDPDGSEGEMREGK